MNISQRVDNLERALETHLIESGSIKTDLIWIKRAIMGVFALGGAILTTVIVDTVSRLLR